MCMKMEKEKIVVYSLGKKWIEYKSEIESRYTIVACSDKDPEKRISAEGYLFVEPGEICSLTFDRIVVASDNFSITESLVCDYGFRYEDVVNFCDVLGNKVYREQGIIDDSIELTVVIPTYNREERLCVTLENLSRQSCQNFSVIVVDNDSPYDIERIRCRFSGEFNNRITIHRNNFNIGMHGNLAEVFGFVRSGWVWTLSDDDIPTEYAIEIIKNTIHNTPDAGVFMFALSNLFTRENSENAKCIHSLNELAKFYSDVSKDGWNSAYSGDFFFISNKVYRADICEKYIAGIYKNAYSGIPQIYPILKMLDDRSDVFLISNEKIVNYSSGEKISWNIYETALSMCSVADWDVQISDEDKIELLKFCSIYYRTVLSSNINDKSEREKYIIGELYRRVYSLTLSENEKREYEQYLKGE